MGIVNQDLSSNLYNRNLVCSGETPFDSYYAPQNNEDHISLTPANVAWITNEINGLPQPPTYSNNNSIQLVSGTEPLCTGSNVYTVSNIPTGATIAWKTSPVGIANPSSASGNQVTVSRIVNGDITLTATLSFCTKPAMVIVSRIIHVGTPGISIAYSMNGSCSNGYQTWSLNATSPGTVSSWLWSVDNPSSGSWYIQNPNSPNTFVDVSGGGGISVTAANSCGTSKTGVTIYSNCPPGFGAITATPNPTTNNVNIALAQGKSDMTFEKVKKAMIYLIKITDQLGNVKKQFKYSSGVSSANISLTGLISGLYNIQAFDGVSWRSTKVIKQ